MNVMTGQLRIEGTPRIGVVISRFNSLIGQRLLDGTLETLARFGVSDKDIVVAWVPGSFEIPIAARTMAEHQKVDAIICLGTIIRGETSHFDHIAGATTQGIAAVGNTTGIPTIFGVVTAETLEQALDRAGGKQGNRGADAAVAAVEMISLLGQLGAGKVS